MTKPEDMRYSDTHEWVLIQEEAGEGGGEGAKVATIGITDFAVQQLTDLVFMELPEVGRQVEEGEELGEVESVKAVSPLYSPVHGEVIAVNTELPDKLETLGSDPYGAGWLVKVRLSDESSLTQLMDFAAYQKQCAEEGD